MGRNVTVDFKELEQLQKQVVDIQKEFQDEFFRACAKEITARLLKKVIQRTPVGQYSKESGKKGGTLKKGWTAQDEKTAMYTALFDGAGTSVGEYVGHLSITKQGDSYVVEVINPVEYASYVEYGHRTPNHKKWVQGHHMMTISAKEIEDMAPALLQKRVEQKLREAFR